MYKPQNICTATNNTKCLFEVKYVATRSDGRKVNVKGVYDYRGKGATQFSFQPHFFMDHLKKLRNAYYADPSLGGQLYDQVDYLVSKAVSRNGALVWESDTGYAHQMEQGEYAYLFASIANAFKSHNDLKSAKGIMTYALKFARTFNIQVAPHSGGVSSITTYCGAKRARLRPCYWFHGRGVELKGYGKRTVLNKHLHSIRDLLFLYNIVRQCPELIDSQFGSHQVVLDNLEDKAIGGLYQLAFSEGHKGKTAPFRPPNIMQFMNRKTVKVKPTKKHPDGNPLSYFWSYYEFDMDTGEGSDIKAQNVCHYHTHTLNLIANIKTFLDDPATQYFRETDNGWRLHEAMDALLEGRGEPTGKLNSKNAIYQFYRSESPTYKVRRQLCKPGIEVLSEEATALYKRLFD